MSSWAFMVIALVLASQAMTERVSDRADEQQKGTSHYVSGNYFAALHLDSDSVKARKATALGVERCGSPGEWTDWERNDGDVSAATVKRVWSELGFPPFAPGSIVYFHRGQVEVHGLASCSQALQQTLMRLQDNPTSSAAVAVLWEYILNPALATPPGPCPHVGAPTPSAHPAVHVDVRHTDDEDEIEYSKPVSFASKDVSYAAARDVTEFNAMLNAAPMAAASLRSAGEPQLAADINIVSLSCYDTFHGQLSSNYAYWDFDQDFMLVDVYAFYCPPFCASGGGAALYGTYNFSSDSSICLAALYAGIVTYNAGGLVLVTANINATSFSAGTANGVTAVDKHPTLPQRAFLARSGDGPCLGFGAVTTLPVDGVVRQHTFALNNILPVSFSAYCGTDNNVYYQTPGDWYTLVGDGRAYDVTTCDVGWGPDHFDTLIMVMRAPSLSSRCTQCVASNRVYYGSPSCAASGGNPQFSRVQFFATAGVVYHIFITQAFPEVEATYGLSASPIAGTESIPASWTCLWSLYVDSTCDCGCGAPDPKCDGVVHVVGFPSTYSDHCMNSNAIFNNYGCCATNGSAENFVGSSCANCRINTCANGGHAPGSSYTCAPSLYSAPSGVVREPEAAYDCYIDYANCYYSINVPGATTLYLKVDGIETETTYDYVLIYKGTSELLYQYSGTYQMLPPFEIAGSTATILFTSDVSVAKRGFNISYCSSVDPSCVACTPACPTNAYCNAGTCVCKDGYSGTQCEIYDCTLSPTCGHCTGHTDCTWCPNTINGAAPSAYTTAGGACRSVNALGTCYASFLTTCPCTAFTTCTDCRAAGACGYCFDGSTCMSGDKSKPLSSNCVDWAYGPGLCPTTCADNCNGNGACACSSASCVCNCYFSFTGTTCATGVFNTWTAAVGSLKPLCSYSSSSSAPAQLEPLLGHSMSVFTYAGVEYVGIIGGLTQSCDLLGLSMTNRTFLYNTATKAFSSDLTTTGFPKLALHSAVVVNTGQIFGITPHKVLIFGGFDPTTSTVSSAVYSYTPPLSFENVCPNRCDALSTPRYGMASAYYAAGNAVALFGGKDDNGVILRSFAFFNVSTYAWTYASATAYAPLARRSATMNCVGSKLYLFGGTDCADDNFASASCRVFADFWIYDFLTDTWTQTSIVGEGPPALVYHTATYHSDLNVIYVFGGTSGVMNATSAMYVYSIKLGSWKTIAYNTFTGGTLPSARYGHTAAIVTESGITNLLVVSGFGGTTFVTDVYRYHIGPLLWNVSTTTLSPRGTTMLTVSGSFPSGSRPPGLACAFGPVIDNTNPTPTSFFATSPVILYNSTSLTCLAPDHPAGAVQMSIIMTAMVTVVNKAQQQYIFYGGTTANMTYTDCPAGSYTNCPSGGTCRWVAGTAAACPLCFAGEFSSVGTVLACSPCQSGAASTREGAAQCTSCPAGSYAGNGGAACIPCSAGTYAPDVGSVQCFSCAKTSYQPASNQSSCITCPTSSTANTLGATNYTQCICNYGYYGPNGGPCTQCDSVSMYCPGGTLYPAAATGYWRPSADSALVFACSPSAACYGGANGESCATGYGGRLCAVCAPGYYKLSGYCEACPSDKSVWKLVLAGLAAVLAVFGLSFFANPSSTSSSSSNSSGSSVSMPSVHISVPSIGISFYQITALFASFKLEWPKMVVDLYGYISALNINFGLLSPECSVSLSTYEKWELQMYIPLIMLGFFAFNAIPVFTFLYLRSRKKAPGTFKISALFMLQVGIGGYLLFLTLIYVFISDVTLSLFACTYQSDGTWSLNIDPSKYCYNAEWRSHLGWGVTGIFLYVIGIPAAFFGVLVYIRRKYGRERLAKLKPTHFFIAKYEDKFFFWEITVLIRKLAIVIFVRFFANQIVLQSVLAILVLFAALLLTASFRPFVESWNDNIDMMLLIANFLVLFSGIVSTSSNADSATRTVVAYVVIAVVSTSSAMIAIATAQELWKKVKEQYRLRIKKVHVKEIESMRLNQDQEESTARLLEEIQLLDVDSKRRVLTALEASTSGAEGNAWTRVRGPSDDNVVELTEVSKDEAPPPGPIAGKIASAKGRTGAPSAPSSPRAKRPRVNKEPTSRHLDTSPKGDKESESPRSAGESAVRRGPNLSPRGGEDSPRDTARDSARRPGR